MKFKLLRLGLIAEMKEYESLLLKRAKVLRYIGGNKEDLKQ